MGRMFTFIKDLAEADPRLLMALGAALVAIVAIALYRRATKAKRLKAHARIVRARK